jgi:heme A synthase
MENPWPHRYAVLVAACSVLLFVTGPVLSPDSQKPLYSLGETHGWLGALVTILAAGLAVWLSRSKEPVWLPRLAWVAVGANLVQDLAVFATWPIPAAVKIAHTLFGQLFFSTAVVIAVLTSVDRNEISKPIQESSRLRRLATTTAVLVLAQVILGAIFRHGITGSMPHILGAVVVAVFLGPAMAEVFRAGRAELRSAGIVLTMTAVLQILLGFALLTMESLEADPMVVAVTTIAHVVLGSCTLAASVVTAILVRRATTGSQMP